jgi:tetratricopeptide (TPR) repeat protein
LLRRFLNWTIGVLVLTAAYLYAFPSPTVSYAIVVLAHAGVGVAATIALVVFLTKHVRGIRGLSRAGWLLMLAGAAVGVALMFIGTARPQWNWLYAHIAVSLAATALLLAHWLSRRTHADSQSTWRTLAVVAGCVALMAGAGLAAQYARNWRWYDEAHRIVNPALPPETMDGEGDGPSGKFFPSSAQTLDGKNIPSNYFMESDSCQRCHQDIYKQWYTSAHHFSSFNNQWYRKSIEYMQDVVGTRPSKWCGGCHDPAVLYSGLMDTPIRQIVHRPEAQAGLGCMMCHSIARVKSTMGQGDFVLEYPKLHELAASKNPIVRIFHDYVIRLNPEPHRRTFLKPFMRQQTAEFCSSCHKVHLDVPVNSYRWIRGFNEYDNWQASGVSGQGARSFYYPAKSSQCADCHMPGVASHDDGNVKGEVHSHAFPGANSALPFANRNDEQLKLTTDFLKNSVTVDIFALTPARKLASGDVAQSDTATTFAVGEEAETTAGPAAQLQAVPLTAPLDRVHASVRRGDDVAVEVVVRTRKVGHFFPGGTVDAYDTWIELKATDDAGRVIFWSGKVEDDGRGPVEKGAHFYRSLLVDAHDNPINKRNAWAARAVVYVRLIPPGAADTVHYRLHVPSDAGNHIKLHARLCYRKFSWFNTHFSYAGEAEQKAAYSAHFDDRPVAFTANLTDVSGELKQIPDLPIVPISENEVELTVLPANAPAPKPAIALQKEDWTRWNDYGIGLFLQGDLKGARAAFEKITQIDASNPDGWVNIGRVALQEGDMDTARDVLQRALQLAPNLARAHFFYSKVLRNDGKYPEAVAHLEQVLAQYPRDRVARNDVGRLLFLQRRYRDAVAQLQQVLAVDPEDLQAHYNLMLCYSGLGDAAMSERERKLYLRFKADESAQAITGEYRRQHPEDNDERQPIHEHVSVALPGASSKARPAAPIRRTASVAHNATGGK